MSEVPGETSPQKQENSLAKWTDEERMSEFTDSEDPTCLTPELAREMKLPYHLMCEVPGVTEDDLELSKQWQTEQGNLLNWIENEFLETYGLDERTLQTLKDEGPIVYLQHLLDVASVPVSAVNADTQNDDRDAADRVVDLLREFLLNTENSVHELFSAIDYETTDGIKDIQIVKHIFREIHGDFIQLSNTLDVTEKDEILGRRYADILNHFAKVTNEFLEYDMIPGHINYLTDRYFYNFCIERKFTEPGMLDNEQLPSAEQMVGLERLADFDRDVLIPFEIEKGKIAVFGRGKGVLYIVGEEYTKERWQQIQNLRSQIVYRVAGQYFARRIVADVPEALWSESEWLHDAGYQLGRDTHQEMFRSAEQLRDFLFLQQADMRETIEEEFGVSLKELSIKEQIFFLEYLQNTSVGTAEKMQGFTQQYGINGMRTFLALERGNVTGEQIVSFGTTHPELAEQVFSRYGKLLDAAGSTEALVARELSGGAGLNGEQLESVHDSIVGRAHTLIEKAVGGDQKAIDTLQTQLDQLTTEGVVLSSVTRTLHGTDQLSFDRIKSLSFESVASDSLSPEDVTEMERLYRENYRDARYQNGFIDTIVGKFRETLSDTQHTKWYVLRHEGTPIGFCRFTDQLDEHGMVVAKHFGGFNVNQQFGGGKLGEAMLEHIMQAEGDVPIVAECIPDVAISSKYIEEAGFNAVDTAVLHGVRLLNIVRNADTLSETDKQYGKAEVLGEAREIMPADSFSDFSNNRKMTRYFRHEGKLHGVFRPTVDEFGLAA